MTQDEYKLLTGQTLNYTNEQWATVQNIAKIRLASLLCLDTFPALSSNNQDLALLLANFISATLKFQGSYDAISSKNVRNFTINFNNSATNAFSQIYPEYKDIIEKYSQCGIGIKVERSACHNCGYNYGILNI